MTVGETSDEVQTIDRPIIEFIVLTDCLYNMMLEKAYYMESIATRLVKKARYVGSVRTA